MLSAQCKGGFREKQIMNRVAVSNFTREGESVLASRALSSAIMRFFFFSYLEVSSGGKRKKQINKKNIKIKG